MPQVSEPIALNDTTAKVEQLKSFCRTHRPCAAGPCTTAQHGGSEEDATTGGGRHSVRPPGPERNDDRHGDGAGALRPPCYRGRVFLRVFVWRGPDEAGAASFRVNMRVGCGWRRAARRGAPWGPGTAATDAELSAGFAPCRGSPVFRRPPWGYPGPTAPGCSRACRPPAAARLLPPPTTLPNPHSLVGCCRTVQARMVHPTLSSRWTRSPSSSAGAHPFDSVLLQLPLPARLSTQQRCTGWLSLLQGAQLRHSHREQGDLTQACRGVCGGHWRGASATAAAWMYVWPLSGTGGLCLQDCCDVAR